MEDRHGYFGIPTAQYTTRPNMLPHGGDVFGGESIKLYVDSNGNKSYVIRRVYPHVIEWKDGYEY